MSYMLVSRWVWTSKEYRTATLTQRGIWMCLMAFCTDQMNGGVIEGFGGWSKADVRRVLDAPWAKVMRGSGLWVVDEAGDLHVFGYPLEKEDAYRSKQEGGRKAHEVMREGKARAEAGESDAEVCGKSSEEGGQMEFPLEGGVSAAVDVVPEVFEEREAALVVPDSVVVGEAAVADVVAGEVSREGEDRAQEVERLRAELAELEGVKVGVENGDAWCDHVFRKRELNERIELLLYPRKAAPERKAGKGKRDEVFCLAREVWLANAGGDRRQVLLCVNEVWPRWKRFHVLSREEEVALERNLENYRAFTAKDWEDFYRYYRCFCEKSRRDYWCPGSRARFLQDAVSIYSSSLARWLEG